MHKEFIYHKTGKQTIVELTAEEEAEAIAQAAADADKRKAAEAMSKLREIDLASIRGIREYLAAQPDAPKIIKERETQAAAERAKLTAR